ncbi:hypothetical protein ADUPG1_002477, partial [Aduncisulcus paluster]
QKEKTKMRKSYEELDETLKTTKKKSFQDKMEAIDVKIDKLTEESFVIEKNIDEKLFTEMSKSFGCTTTKEVMDSVKELKMNDDKWELCNFTSYATDFFTIIQESSGVMPDIKRKFLLGLRPKRFAERVSMIEDVDQASNDVCGVRTMLREARKVWMEILETFEEAQALGMVTMSDEKEIETGQDMKQGKERSERGKKKKSEERKEVVIKRPPRRSSKN